MNMIILLCIAIVIECSLPLWIVYLNLFNVGATFIIGISAIIMSMFFIYMGMSFLPICCIMLLIWMMATPLVIEEWIYLYEKYIE